ncbi:MAG: prepilin-type N-terminal cleavage/methylation domain-containing protein [Fimbriimonas sp.]
MRQRGITLMELVLTLVVGTVVLGGLFQALISMSSSFTQTNAINQTVVDASDAANTIAAAIRRSPNCQTRNGCTANPGSAILDGTATTIWLFRDGKGNTVKYSNQLGSIVSTVGSEQNELAETGSFRLRYFGASRYNANELQEFTPTSATFKNVIAIELFVTVTRGRITDTHSTIVRLRNSPM